MTIAEILKQYSVSLREISPSPKLDIELLLAQVLGENKTYLYTWPEKELLPKQQQQFLVSYQRRFEGEPIAYILQRQCFWDLELKVTQDVLIPRADTEMMVEKILELSKGRKELNVIDLGTGSGAIALALAAENPSWKIIATDNSIQALDVAKQNCQNNQINNVQVFYSNWFDNVARSIKFDFIISNPPYIAEDDPYLCSFVKQYEPLSALISERNGLADILQIIKDAKNYLHAHGYLLIEHGFQQGNNVQKRLKQQGYINISPIFDLAGHWRATLAGIS